MENIKMNKRNKVKFIVLILLFALLPLKLVAQQKVSYRLDIYLVGGGTVSPPPGTYYYPKDTIVFLSATPNADWAFDHWEGNISGTDLYTQVTMDGPKAVTAVFVEPDCLLTITHSGDAVGTTFPSAGVYGFVNGRTVGISVATTDGVYFGGWSGDAYGSSEFILVTMNSNKYIDARFTSTGHILNMYVVGEGGTVPSPLGNPHRYSSDVLVDVESQQTNPLWRLDHWEGDIDENDPRSNPIYNLPMDRDRNITAVFILKPYYNLTIEIIGEGNVSLRVGYDTPIILTPGVYIYNYLEWSYIRLEAIETTTGWKFLRWQGDYGDTSPTYPRCSFSMDQDRYVRCLFTDKTQVPDVVGSTQSEATSAITNAWLNVGDITQVCNDEYPSGYVFDQNPSAGTTVEINTTVSLWISTGPCPVPVPDVTGKTQTEAESELNAVGLMLGNVSEQCSNEVEQDIIISQNPLPEELVPPGSRVDIVISSGPCPVAVPNILWQLRPDAEDMILNAGLIVGIVTEQCDDTIPAGRVMNQYPTAGIQVPPGTSVNVTVSSGPCLINVPNVVQYSRTLAENILTSAGLTVGDVSLQCSNTIRTGLIISQSPSAGTKVPPDSAVNLTISSGPCIEGSPEGTPDGEGVTEGEGIQEGEGIIEGTIEGEGISEGEGIIEGSPEGEGTSEGIQEGEGIIEGTSEGEGTVEGEGITEGSAEAEGAQEGEGTVEGEGITEGSAEAEGAQEGEGAVEGEGEKPPHSADPNGDLEISLPELLRVIQFFNAGAYHCEEGTEDGYAPYAGDNNCNPHSSDYNPQDWSIALNELLRLIQFFNMGGYHPCPDGEDGYCPG